MSLQVDPSLNWLFDIVAGQSWPQSDEDLLRGQAGRWDDLGKNVVTVGGGFRRLSQRVTGHITGDVATNFQDFAEKLGSVGGLLSQRTGQQSAALRQYALNTENAKYSMLIAIAEIAASILAAAANPFFSWMVPEFLSWLETLIELYSRVFSGRVAVLLAELTEAVAEEAVEEVAEDLLAQVIQDGQGHRHGLTISSILQSAALGGAGGMFAHQLAKGLRKVDAKTGAKLLHGAVGHATVEGVTQLGVSVLGAGAFGGGFSGLGWESLNGGLSGAATHGAHRGGEALHSKVTGGGGDDQVPGPKDSGAVELGPVGLAPMNLPIPVDTVSVETVSEDQVPKPGDTVSEGVSSVSEGEVSVSEDGEQSGVPRPAEEPVREASAPVVGAPVTANGPAGVAGVGQSVPHGVVGAVGEGPVVQAGVGQRPAAGDVSASPVGGEPSGPGQPGRTAAPTVVGQSPTGGGPAVVVGTPAGTVHAGVVAPPVAGTVVASVSGPEVGATTGTAGPSEVGTAVPAPEVGSHSAVVPGIASETAPGAGSPVTGVAVTSSSVVGTAQGPEAAVRPGVVSGEAGLATGVASETGIRPVGSPEAAFGAMPRVDTTEAASPVAGLDPVVAPPERVDVGDQAMTESPISQPATTTEPVPVRGESGVPGDAHLGQSTAVEVPGARPTSVVDTSGRPEAAAGDPGRPTVAEPTQGVEGLTGSQELVKDVVTRYRSGLEFYGHRYDAQDVLRETNKQLDELGLGERRIATVDEFTRWIHLAGRENPGPRVSTIDLARLVVHRISGVRIAGGAAGMERETRVGVGGVAEGGRAFAHWNDLARGRLTRLESDIAPLTINGRKVDVPVFEAVTAKPMASLPGEGRYLRADLARKDVSDVIEALHAPGNVGKPLMEVLPGNEVYTHPDTEPVLVGPVWQYANSVHLTSGMPLAAVRHVLQDIVDHVSRDIRDPNAPIRTQHLHDAQTFGEDVAKGFLAAHGERVRHVTEENSPIESAADEIRNFATLVYSQIAAAMTAASHGGNQIGKLFSYVASRTDPREVFNTLRPVVQDHLSSQAPRLLDRAVLTFRDGQTRVGDSRSRMGIERSRIAADDQTSPTVSQYFHHMMGLPSTFSDVQQYFGVNTRVPLQHYGRAGVPLAVIELRETALVEEAVHRHEEISALIRDKDAEFRRSKGVPAPLDAGIGPWRTDPVARFDENPASEQVDVRGFRGNRAAVWVRFKAGARARLASLPTRHRVRLVSQARAAVAVYLRTFDPAYAHDIVDVVASRMYEDEVTGEALWGPHELARDLVAEFAGPRAGQRGGQWSRDDWEGAIAQAYAFLVDRPDHDALEVLATNVLGRRHELPVLVRDQHDPYRDRFAAMRMVVAHQLGADSDTGVANREGRARVLVESMASLPGARPRTRSGTPAFLAGTSGPVPSNRVGDARIENWSAQAVPDVKAVRNTARALFGNHSAAGQHVHDKITEDVLRTGWPNALRGQGGQTIDIDGNPIVLTVQSIEQLPSGDAVAGTSGEVGVEHVGGSSKWSATDSAARAQSDLSTLLQVPTPYVSVSASVQGNTATAEHSVSRVASESTKITEHLPTVVRSYRVTYSVDRPGRTQRNVSVTMRLSSPTHAGEGREQDIPFAYPAGDAITSAETRTSRYDQVADAVNSIEHADLEISGLVDSLKSHSIVLNNEQEHTRFRDWLRSLGEKNAAQGLFGEGTIRKTFDFKHGPLHRQQEVIIKLRPRGATAGSPSATLLAKLLDRDEVTITHSHDSTTKHSAVHDVKHGLGGQLSLESDKLTSLIGPKLSLDLSFARTSTEVSRDDEDYRLRQSETYQGQADIRRIDFDYVVSIGTKGWVVPGSALLTLVEQPVTPDSGARPDGPDGMAVADVVDSVHARYELDDATVNDLVGATLTRLQGSAAAGINFGRTKEDLVDFVRANARDIVAGNDGTPGDGVSFPLGDEGGAPYLFLRGHVQRAGGRYLGTDKYHRFGDIVDSGHSRGLNRSRHNEAGASVTVKAGVGPADLKGTVGVSSDTRHDDSLTNAESAEQAWTSRGELHRYRYPSRIEVLVGKDVDDAAVLLELGDSYEITVTAPELSGQSLATAEARPRPESAWHEPTTDAVALPADNAPTKYEVESQKPLTGLRKAATDALAVVSTAYPEPRAVTKATQWITSGSAPESLAETQDGLPGGHAVGEWSRRDVRFVRAALATSGARDRLDVERHNKGAFVGAAGRDAFGALTLHTKLFNPRILRVDNARVFTDSHSRKIVRSGGDHHDVGVTGTVKAGFSKTFTNTVTTSGNAEATGKAGFRHETDTSANTAVEITTKSVHRSRGYLLQYDAVHELTATARQSATGLLGHRHDGVEASTTVVKDQPDAMTVWVEAGDIPAITLPREQVAKLEAADRTAYLRAYPQLGPVPQLRADLPELSPVALPRDPIGGVGTFALDRAGAMNDLLDGVQTALGLWHGTLTGLAAERTAELGRLSHDVMTELASSMDGFGFRMEDVLKGGTLVLRTRDSAESGRAELLVVIDGQLSNGTYRDSLADHRSTITYAITSNDESSTGNVLSGSVATEGGLSVGLPSTHVVRVDSEIGDQLDKITGKVHPATSAQASWTGKVTRQRHGQDAVTIEQSGTAFRFAYDLRVTVRVFPWMHDGAVVQRARDLLHDTKHRLRTSWTSQPFTVPSAVRLTIGADQHRGEDQPDGGLAQPSGTVRSRRPATPKFGDDAVIHVHPFLVGKLHKALDEVSAGSRAAAGGDAVPMSAHRSHEMRSAATATEVARNFWVATSRDGYRMPLNGPTVKALRLKFDLTEVALIGTLADTTLTRAASDHSQSGRSSDLSGKVQASIREEGEPWERQGKVTRKKDAATTEHQADPSAGESVFLVHARLRSEVTAEYVDQHTPRKPTSGAEASTENTLVRMVVNRAGLRDLGFEMDRVAQWEAQQHEPAGHDPRHAENTPSEAPDPQPRGDVPAGIGRRGRSGVMVMGPPRGGPGQHHAHQAPSEGPYYYYQQQGQYYYYPALPVQQPQHAMPVLSQAPTAHAPVAGPSRPRTVTLPSPPRTGGGRSWDVKRVVDPQSSASDSEASSTAFPHRGVLSGTDSGERWRAFQPEDVAIHPVRSGRGDHRKVVAFSFHTMRDTQIDLEYNIQVQRFRKDVSVLRHWRNLEPGASHQINDNDTDWKKLSLYANEMFILDAHSPDGRNVTVRLEGAHRLLHVDAKTFATIVINRREFQEAVRVLDDRYLAYMLLICNAGKIRGPGGIAYEFAQAMRRHGYFGTVLAPTSPIWMATSGPDWFLQLDRNGEITSFPGIGLGGTVEPESLLANSVPSGFGRVSKKSGVLKMGTARGARAEDPGSPSTVQRHSVQMTGSPRQDNGTESRRTSSPMPWGVADEPNQARVMSPAGQTVEKPLPDVPTTPDAAEKPLPAEPTGKRSVRERPLPAVPVDSAVKPVEVAVSPGAGRVLPRWFGAAVPRRRNGGVRVETRVEAVEVSSPSGEVVGKRLSRGGRTVSAFRRSTGGTETVLGRVPGAIAEESPGSADGEVYQQVVWAARRAEQVGRHRNGTPATGQDVTAAAGSLVPSGGVLRNTPTGLRLEDVRFGPVRAESVPLTGSPEDAARAVAGIRQGLAQTQSARSWSEDLLALSDDDAASVDRMLSFAGQGPDGAQRLAGLMEQAGRWLSPGASPARHGAHPEWVGVPYQHVPRTERTERAVRRVAAQLHANDVLGVPLREQTAKLLAVSLRPAVRTRPRDGVPGTAEQRPQPSGEVGRWDPTPAQREKLALRALVEAPTNPNGDCLFEAVLTPLLRRPPTREEIENWRNRVADRLQTAPENGLDYRLWFAGTDGEYRAAVDELRQPGAYTNDAGDLVPIALAEVLRARLTVLDERGESMGDGDVDANGDHGYGPPSAHKVLVLRVSSGEGHYLGVRSAPSVPTVTARTTPAARRLPSVPRTVPSASRTKPVVTVHRPPSSTMPVFPQGFRSLPRPATLPRPLPPGTHSP